MFFKVCSYLVLLNFLNSGIQGSKYGTLERSKRGASVYRMYIPSSGGHNPYLLSNNDPSSFLQYLGGGGSSYNAQSPKGGNALLSSYNQHVAAQPTYGQSSGGGGGHSSRGRQTHGAGGGYSSSHTPTFSSGGDTGSGWSPRTERPSNDHQHSASVLLHAAQGSFNAQTEVFNALTAGSMPASYKGSGCPGC